MNIKHTETRISSQLLKVERQDHIRRLLEQAGRVTVPELVSLFNVSEATVRRDLEDIDGLWARRTRGGAVRLQLAAKEPPFLQRSTEQVEEKKRIGRAAAQMIREGETVFLGSGSTVLEVARSLPENLRLTVITNSLPVVNLFSDFDAIEIIVIGGMLRPSEQSMVGHIAEQDIREIRADRVFMGMRGIDPAQGFTNDFLPETLTDRAILGIARQVVIVADHTKFGKISSVFVAPVSAASLIITDKAAPPDILAALGEAGIKVILV